MLEWKSSFKTKDAATAQRLWVEENRRFAEAERVAEIVFQSQRGNVTGSDALRAAKQIAELSGFHPDQAPKLPPNPTDADWEAFKTERADWEMWLAHQRELLAEQDAEDRLDHEQLERDYKSGRWAEQGYEAPYRKPKPNSVISLATKILEGEIAPKLEPSWRDAVELYISVNKQDKTRDPLKERDWEVKTRGLLERFGRAHGGMSARLDQLDRAAIRSWMQATYTKQSTRNRYLNTLSAVINTWNREHAANPVPNPFSGLANKQREQEQATKRLSFNPDQFDKFLAAINALKNDEIRLVGLLMAYTGCRNSEAAGLQCRDVKLDADVPHVVFRSNKIRRMGKGGLERAVPVVEPLLSALKTYDRNGGQDDPFFAKYGHTRGFDTVSITLRNTLTNRAGIVQEGLVPYSLRHTMKDRLDAAGVRTDIAEYILGHTSQGASRIHQRYGTTTPPQSLVESIESALQVEDWGYYD